MTHNRKNKSVKIESSFQGQVIYWKDTEESHSTPLSKPLKIESLIIKLKQLGQLINQIIDTTNK